MAGKRIGVVLSGCGVHDGAEIHEATLTLYFLDRAGAEAVCMAPNIPQHHVINHLTQKEAKGSRNVLVESARIARGNIRDLAAVQAEELDGLILPGGFGAAKNLSSFAFDGPSASVDPGVRALLKNMRQAGKPIGAICIAPAVVAKVFADKGINVTIGHDQGTASAIESLGNRHTIADADQIVIDEANKLVTTAAYMCGRSISEVGEGIEKLVNALLERA